MRIDQNMFRNRRGFSLVELAVVVIIIGVLAAFGVPKFKDSVERSKASEAFSYLSAVRSSQERYQARHGIYSDALSKLDVAVGIPKYFTTGAMTEDHTTAPGSPTWAMTVTRIAASSSYGAYVIKYTQDGPDSATTVTSNIFGASLTDKINPMAN